MFLIETIKRIFREMPEGKEPEEGWDVCEGLLENDVTDVMSPNYDPLVDPGSWYNTIDHGDD